MCEAQRDGIRAGATKAKTEALGTVALSDVLVVSTTATHKLDTARGFGFNVF